MSSSKSKDKDRDRDREHRSDKDRDRSERDREKDREKDRGEREKVTIFRRYKTFYLVDASNKNIFPKIRISRIVRNLDHGTEIGTDDVEGKRKRQHIFDDAADIDTEFSVQLQG